MGWDGVQLAGDGHLGEDFQVGLDLGPFIFVLFGGDGGERVGVVVGDVVLDLGGDGLRGIHCQFGEKCGVGLVGESVGAGLYLFSGVEVAIGQVVADGVEVAQDQAHGVDGTIDALDVEVFGVLVRPANGEESERAYLGEDEDESGIQVAGEAGVLAIQLPVVVGRRLNEVFG